MIIKVCDRCGKRIDVAIPCNVPRITRYDVVTPKGAKLMTFDSGIEQKDMDICHDCLWDLARIMDLFFGKEQQ